jgi:hypothetical protein
MLEEGYASILPNFRERFSLEMLVNFDKHAGCHFPKNGTVVPLWEPHISDVVEVKSLVIISHLSYRTMLNICLFKVFYLPTDTQYRCFKRILNFTLKQLLNVSVQLPSSGSIIFELAKVIVVKTIS